MGPKVAVVTGSNKGIGFGIVRGLCKRFDGKVYLTSRNTERGLKAVAELNKEGLNPEYHQLDITDKKSLETFRDYIKSKYDGIDILVNNAAIVFKKAAPEPPSVVAKETLFVNYFSLVSTCDILFPILKNGARVVNVSSSMGHLTSIPCEELKKKLNDDNLTVPELSKLMQRYVDDVKEGNYVAKWGNVSYSVSKVGVCALTKIQQRMLNGRDIKVNSCHPGYVDTDMTSHKGIWTIDEGAATPLFLALDADDSVRGQYIWHTQEIVDWAGVKPALGYTIQ